MPVNSNVSSLVTALTPRVTPANSVSRGTHLASSVLTFVSRVLTLSSSTPTLLSSAAYAVTDASGREKCLTFRSELAQEATVDEREGVGDFEVHFIAKV
jgi:hypothetical protein